LSIHGPYVVGTRRKNHNRIAPTNALGTHRSTMKGLQFSGMKWQMKDASANSIVGEKLVKWGIQIYSDCPCYGESETTIHILQSCQAHSANKQQWGKSTDKLKHGRENEDPPITTRPSNNKRLSMVWRRANATPSRRQSMHPPLPSYPQQRSYRLRDNAQSMHIPVLKKSTIRILHMPGPL
jgi:hypothetical protein